MYFSHIIYINNFIKVILKDKTDKQIKRKTDKKEKLKQKTKAKYNQSKQNEDSLMECSWSKSNA
jgi:hypothetical protein